MANRLEEGVVVVEIEFVQAQANVMVGNNDCFFYLGKVY